MTRVGQYLILAGVLTVVVGMLLLLVDRVPFLSWVGRLPGDIRIEGARVRFFFPITTCLVLSALFTLVMSAARYLARYF